MSASTATHWTLTCYEIPGGCVDETDKSLEEAIARELMEETGYRFFQL
ncbi:MAG: NUDIX domain-containing protein [Puia sp.]